MTRTEMTVELPEIAEVIVCAMGKAIEVDVTTAIAADLDCLEDNRRFDLSLSTQIDLLDKTINREIDLQLIDNPAYGELQQWHVEQVQQRQNNLVSNLASLVQMQRIISR